MLTVAGLAAVLLIVALNALFVAAEFSLVRVRRSRMQELAAQGDRRAARVAALLDAPDRFITAVQLGVTATSLGLGALGQPLVADLLAGPVGLLPERWEEAVTLAVATALAFALLVALHVIAGELVPKAVGLDHAERTALALAGPIGAFERVLRPVIWLLVRATAAILRALHLPLPTSMSLAHTEDELKMLVVASRREGVLLEDEQAMLHKVFEFADKDAADVMVPRPDMVGVRADTPPEQVLELVLDRPYTRYPVYGEDIDDILGILHVRDLFTAIHRAGLGRVDLRELLRPAIVVPETKALDELLAEFRRTSNHMAIVVDEYGSVAGLVTLEDLLEEIVGEIGDEFDLPDTAIRRLGRGRVRIEGSFPIDEFNDRFGTDLPNADYHTVGGFVFGELGRAPAVGDVVARDGLRFEVAAVDGSRIVQVDVTFPVERPLAGAAAERG
jgi:CBS domain containing-hemolysin-like protein